MRRRGEVFEVFAYAAVSGLAAGWACLGWSLAWDWETRAIVVVMSVGIWVSVLAAVWVTFGLRRRR